MVGLGIKLAPGTLGTVSAAHARKWYSFLDDFDQKSPMCRSKRNVCRFSGMTLGDSPCTLLVSPWLGEVVGASLAMG